MRTILPLESDWEFSRDTEPGARVFEPVGLPHAWNTSPDGVPADHDDRAPGFYRRQIQAPGTPEDRRVLLRIGAAGTVADVWCNDVHVGRHRGGYSAFCLDLTDALDAEGNGEILLRVDNSPTDDVYPLMGDHTIFGGLYRGAELITVPAVHITPGEHAGPGIRVRQVSLEEVAANFQVHVSVANTTTATVTPDVGIQVTDDEGTAITSAVTAVSVPAGEVVDAWSELTIHNPRRWDGRRDPYQYQVTATVGEDTVTIPLGLREIRVDPEEGFLLNGRRYPLRGVSRHHDVNGTPAVSARDIARDFDLIDEMGANAVRLAHYQHGEAVLDECDRRGILVWAEIPVNSQVSATDPITNAAQQLRELIAQQRHHPSIVCWGIQNEAIIGQAAMDPRQATAELADIAREEDPDRFTAQAQLLLVEPDDPINRACDLNAQNLYHGWYLGSSEEVGGVLDAHRAANPDIPLALSEYGADARTEYHTDEPTPGDYTEEYQAILHETYLAQIDQRPWLWSTFVWNMFDFASVIRNEGGTRGFNMKGLVTRDRKIRKDAFHWYKVNWSDEPTVHICSKRFANRTGDSMTIKVYSNQPAVLLTVNDQELGERAVDGRIATFEVPLGFGATTVVATAGTVTDEAVFERVAEPDPSYVCPAPRRVAGSDSMDSWYEEAGIEVDPSGYGTFSLLGELLDDPNTRAILTDTFGAAMLDHPQIDIGRGFSLDFVLSAVAADMSLDERRRLHEALAAVEKPAAD